MIVEICVEGIDGAITAFEAGADRIELCAALSEGGITPSMATIRAAVRAVNIPVHVIIRPRGGDFLYSDAEFSTMLYDVQALRKEGVKGVVVGCLNANGTVDEARMADLVAAAGPMSVTCHRAFDMTRDPLEALETLVRAGVARVLTSGQKDRAMDAVDMFLKLKAAAKDRIIIMGCGRLEPDMVGDFYQATQLDEIHFAALEEVPSPMVYRNDQVGMGGEADLEREYRLTVTSSSKVRAMLHALRSS